MAMQVQFASKRAGPLGPLSLLLLSPSSLVLSFSARTVCRHRLACVSKLVLIDDAGHARIAVHQQQRHKQARRPPWSLLSSLPTPSTPLFFPLCTVCRHRLACVSKLVLIDDVGHARIAVS